MKKIIVKLFSNYIWLGKSMRKSHVNFFLLPGITFIHDRMPIAVGGLNGTRHCFIIFFTWLLLSLDVLRVEYFSKDKEQDDNMETSNPGTTIFHEEEC